MTTLQTDSGRTSRPFIEAAIVYVAFCGLSILSRLVPPLFFLVVVGGIVFPLFWGKRTRDWASLGFTRRKLGRALLWGVCAGLVAMLYVAWGAKRNPLPEPPLRGLQIAIGIPLAILILGPFQEFFFRGWLQPRLERALGVWPALLATSLSFAVWHLLPPFEGSPTSAVRTSSLEGILTTLGMGLVFGYIRQRTDSIVAPWLAHAMMIVALVAVGGMTFVQYTP